MNSRQRKTLAAIFTDPTPSSIAWADIESLLKAVSCTAKGGKGSHVQFDRDGVRAAFARPHPSKEAKRYQVRDARAFLERIGIRP
jgi:hypothetical protein